MPWATAAAAAAAAATTIRRGMRRNKVAMRALARFRLRKRTVRDHLELLLWQSRRQHSRHQRRLDQQLAVCQTAAGSLTEQEQQQTAGAAADTAAADAAANNRDLQLLAAATQYLAVQRHP